MRFVWFELSVRFCFCENKSLATALTIPTSCREHTKQSRRQTSLLHLNKCPWSCHSGHYLPEHWRCICRWVNRTVPSKPPLSSNLTFSGLRVETLPAQMLTEQLPIECPQRLSCVPRRSSYFISFCVYASLLPVMLMCADRFNGYLLLQTRIQACNELL